MWAQDEPRNQGAGPFLRDEVVLPGDRRLKIISRSASASPATGSSKRHQREQSELVRRVLTL